ncbi:hypothetical protein B0H67DRAFT_474411 [Lasiosphaeris hirsuta]|uniref:Ribosomal RNA methyltransferase FtsJ domain-containing protein n=1 Tax=Lasiosphaeris hirsuta TaxID=260670 RepID=A0AA40BCX6_9PEZI|nr:hypothetical protein B0H67DRAFT_474411 [Lasiosphaeris hirsuta]
MAEATSRSGPAGGSGPVDITPRPTALVQEYLRKHLRVFCELQELQRLVCPKSCPPFRPLSGQLTILHPQGWENEQGDAYFQQQRQRADHADDMAKLAFFDHMRHIGAEMDQATSALTIAPSATTRPAILDLCMAPGGFSYAALLHNPTAELCGVTLPPSQGGHDLLIPDWASSPDISVSFRDITMLASELGVDAIPPTHPDAAAFSRDRPFAGRQFDLVFCDGQVLRTHDRGAHAAYRASPAREAARLLTAQLVLALQRIRPGGTLVALLHRAGTWHALAVVHAVAGFADVALFKPARAHRTRSSFYLVARNVRPESAAAREAVAAWKARWRAATFGGEDDGDLAEVFGHVEDDGVEAVLKAFGPRYAELAEPVFAVQAEALRRAPFVRGRNQRGRWSAGAGAGAGPGGPAGRPSWR